MCVRIDDDLQACESPARHRYRVIGRLSLDLDACVHARLVQAVSETSDADPGAGQCVTYLRRHGTLQANPPLRHGRQSTLADGTSSAAAARSGVAREEQADHQQHHDPCQDVYKPGIAEESQRHISTAMPQSSLGCLSAGVTFGMQRHGRPAHLNSSEEQALPRPRTLLPGVAGASFVRRRLSPSAPIPR